MRIILSIIALFSAGGLLAQEYVPTCGRELPRSRVTVYPTAQEAAAAAGGKTFSRPWTGGRHRSIFPGPRSP